MRDRTGWRAGARVRGAGFAAAVVLLAALVFAAPAFAAETEAPTVPTNLVVIPGVASPNIAVLTWDASTDNVEVTGYRVWRSIASTGTPVLLGDTAALSFMDVTGVPGQPYWYAVSAFDGSGNESSRTVVVGPTLAGWVQPPHTTYSVTGAVCKMCHAPHVAASPIALMRQTGSAPGEVSVCLACHDGQGASTNIATGPDNSFALASGHSVEEIGPTGDLTDTCSGCHGPHADYTTKRMLPAAEVNGVAVTAADNTWCLACHNDTNDWFGAGYPALSSPSRDASGYPTLGTFPGESVYTDTGINGHASSAASATAGREQGDCLYCHDSHRATGKYDGLTAAFRPSTASTVATDQANGVYAASCFECHGGTGGSYFTTPPAGAVDIKQFVTAGGERSGHRIKTAGGLLPVGAPLPCYDCHNPHGSARGNASMIADSLGQNLSTATDAKVRQFCFTCHSSWDGKVWNSVTSTMTAVGTDSVEGLRRDGSDGSLLELPAVSGHGAADATSCYVCHGTDYGPGGKNVHDPGAGESAGGADCFDCHDYTAMQSNSTYHHYMASDSAAAYATIADPTTLTTADVRRTCLMCHVDHDYFSPDINSNPAHTAGRAQNMRASISSTPAKGDASTYVDYDYSDLDAGDGGVCTSCHKVQMPKNATGRNATTDRSSVTVPVRKADYGLSAHNYFATAPDYMSQSAAATFTSDSSGFKVNCGKCHNDTTTKLFQSGTFTFGLHDSSIQALLADNGQPVGTDPQEAQCYLCHSRVADAAPNNPLGGADYADSGTDMYGGALNMGAMMTESLNVKGTFTDAGIVSRHPVTGNGTTTSRVECANCHNPHKAEFPIGFGMASGVVQDPDNTLVGSSLSAGVYWSGPAADTEFETNRDFCLRCHDGTPPTKVNNGTAYVPYDVFIAAGAAADANKSAFLGRSHFNAVAADTSVGAKTIALSCDSCHDKHGSRLPKLLGESTAVTSTPVINGAAVTANDNGICYACHTAATTGYPAGESQREAGTGFFATGTWPGSAVYTGANGIHKAGNVIWPSTSYVAGDCKNCHDVHGTANKYDETVAAFTNTDFALCFTCHDAGGPAATNIKTYYPVATGGTGGGAGHEIKTAGGNLAAGGALPCYDCHNPHGSASANGLQVRDIGDGAGEIDLSSAVGVRRFCFTCHATSDTTTGWTGSAFAAVGTTSVEGLRRDGSDGSALKLPTVNGHRSGDAQSCYQCHGNDYSGLSTNNVHNPSGGVSAGGQDCYGCHATYQSFMEDGAGTKTGTDRATVYHHVVGGTVSATYYDGDKAFTAGSYPTASATEVFCLSCHVDHDKFNAAKASNLRPDLASANPSGAATDYNSTSNAGVCTSCHANSLTKQVGTDQKNDGSTATPKVLAGGGANQFGASAHDYSASSSYADATSFSANCSKCHNDEQAKDFQTSTNKFGTHWSAARRVLSALGGAVTDPLQESHCYRCHSQTTDVLAGTKKSVANRDWYNATAMTAASERVYAQFQLASKHPVVATGGNSVECESCHNAHVVTSTTGKVTDPNNTYNTLAYGTAAEQATYCLRCHDGNTPAYTVDGTTYVPYSVTIAAGDAAIMNKSTNAARAHWTVNGSITTAQTCAQCHDNHGSAAPKLLGAYDMTDSRNEIAGTQITANNNVVCTACHTAADAAYPSFTRAANGYPTDGTWTGNTVYTGAGGIHNVAGVVWPGTTYAAGDCKNCHDVHGTANTYDELRGTFSPTNFDNCFQCHDGAPSTKNIRQYYPTTNGGGATQTAEDNFGHKIQTPGGTLAVGDGLPCYDCHNPHGNANSTDGLLVITQNNGATLVIGDSAGEINVTTAAGVRGFCFSCHTTADTTAGWNGSAYAVVTGTALVEGIDRKTYDSTNKRGLKLPSLAGHNVGDTTQSCYDCHGDDYTGATTNNVHNPGPGVSNGGLDCLVCHGATSTERYDKMVGDTTMYHHVLDNPAGSGGAGLAPNTGSYPTDTGSLSCVSCHTDHNYFNSNKGANLRQGIGLAGSATANTDFSSTAPYGICISCHNTSLTKNTAGQKSSGNTTGADPSAATPVVTGPGYTASSHNYTVATALGTVSSPFNANCIKCHNDDQVKKYQPNSTTDFAIHYSATRRILDALGYTGADYSDPLGDTFCYKCHKSDNTRYAGNPNAANDYYGVASMSTAAGDVADSMFTTKILAILNGSTTVRSYDVATNTWGTLTGTPAAAPGAGSNLVFHGGNFAYYPGATTAFQMMDPFGTADANDTPSTPRWGTSGSAYSPVLPVAANTGSALASDGMYLYYLQGNATVKAYRLDTRTMAAGNLAGKAWVDTTAAPTIGMADAPATIGDGGSLEWAGGDYLYALRGGATVTAYQYRISTDTWNDANAADLPLATATSADLCWAGGSKIYAIRGTGTNNFYRGTIDSNGAITGWTAVTSPVANFGTGADLTWDGGKYIYAFQGGSTAFWRYNTVTDTWTTMAAAAATPGANSSLVAWRVAGHAEDDPSSHRVDEATSATEGWMPSTSRHVQCTDCHDVHQAKSGTHVVGTTSIATKDLGGANEGVWGTEYAPPTYVVGTATFTNGSATVNGQGTTWTNANGVYPGSWIQNNADKHYYQIQTVNSATQLTLTATYKGATAATSAYTLRLGYTGGTSATFTKGSKTVTGTGTAWSTTVIPVGSYIRSNDLGTWYRVVSVNSATSITINDEYRGATFTGGYNVIRVAFTKVAAGSVTRQYQLCFKCHTGYAWGTGSPPNGQSTGPWGRAWKQTDVAVDFDPVNLAYHPLFQRGRNQPPATANTNWDGTAASGNKAATYGASISNPNTGLDNTFVDGWGTQSLVACTDCHDHPAPATAPSGPHGSSYRWLLKGLDPDVTVTLVGGTVRYPNRAGGTSTGTPYSATALCANCHRGDVYRVSAAQYLATTYDALSRFSHLGVSDGNCVPSLPQDGDTAATYWPNGCMNCHGGDTPGSLHGTSRGIGSAHTITGSTEMGKRFTNGSSWDAHILGTAATGVTCFTLDAANDVSSCTAHNGTTGRGDGLNYTYDWE